MSNDINYSFADSFIFSFQKVSFFMILYTLFSPWRFAKGSNGGSILHLINYNLSFVYFLFELCWFYDYFHEDFSLNIPTSVPGLCTRFKSDENMKISKLELFVVNQGMGENKQWLHRAGVRGCKYYFDLVITAIWMRARAIKLNCGIVCAAWSELE